MKKLALIIAVVFIAVSTFGQTTTTAAKQRQKLLRLKQSPELRQRRLRQRQTPQS